MNMKPSHNYLVETDAAIIQSELHRVLGERRFSGAPQMSAFLRYIVTETLNGHADRIKAFSVGVDALGKPDTFDAQTDPSVRVLALRLRKTLAAVYEDPSHCLAIIDLQVGTYVPTFYKAQKHPQPAAEHASDVPTPTVVAALSRSSAIHPPADVGNKADVAEVQENQEEVIPFTAVDAQGQTLAKPQPGSAVNGLLESNSRVGANRTATEFSLENLWSSKLTLFAGVVLLAAAWQISLTRADSPASSNGGDSNQALSVMNASSGLLSGVASLNNSSELPGTASVPVIFINDAEASPELERRVLMMLSSRFLQSGAVNVVRVSDNNFKQERLPGEYQLMINGYTVDNDLRIDAQVVRLYDGALLYAESVMLGESARSLTSENLGAIETIASGIVSLDGPVFEDYCTKQTVSAREGCPVG